MTQNETFNDDIALDRLVDGELTSVERRQLLESLDKRPEGWRRCALAFLEAQSWREELGQVARGVQSATKVSKSPTSSVPSNRKSQWAAGAKWLALAASLLVAFELGWMQHERGASVANGSPDSGTQVAKVAPQLPADLPRGVKPNDAITFYVNDETGKKQTLRVPLVDADTLDNQYGTKFQSGVPDAMREQLKERGYTVQSKRKYAPLQLENGRSLVVPVEDTQIVPVSDKAL